MKGSEKAAKKRRKGKHTHTQSRTETHAHTCIHMQVMSTFAGKIGTDTSW